MIDRCSDFICMMCLGVTKERIGNVSRGRKGKGRRKNRGFNFALIRVFKTDKRKEIEGL